MPLSGALYMSLLCEPRVGAWNCSDSQAKMDDQTFFLRNTAYGGNGGAIYVVQVSTREKGSV